MAEAGVLKDEHERDITSGSEFVYDFYCEVCWDEGLNDEAVGFCRDCSEYLCNVCIRSHRRSRPTRHHDIMDQMTMPKDTPVSQDRIRKNVSKTCQNHSSKGIEFYCPTHYTFGCGTCFATVQKSCVSTESIYDKAENILDSQEYLDFRKYLAGLLKRAHDMLINTHDDVTVKEVTVLRDDLDAMRSELDNLVSSKSLCQLYIRMKERKNDVEALEDRLNTAEWRMGESCFGYDTNNEIVTSGFGNAVHVNDKSTFSTLIVDINVKANSDSSDCYIKGSVVLSDTLLVLADYRNKKVKLVDTSSNYLKSELEVAGRPYDVAKIHCNLVAVTIQNGGKILIINVTDTLSLERELSVGRDCYGVAYGQEMLIVTFYNSLHLDIMDLQGSSIKRIKEIEMKTKGECFSLGGPKHVCVSTDGESFYVSDYTAGQVLQLAFGGNYEYKAEYNEIFAPEEICTDHCGNVFIAAGNKSVHMLTSECKKIKEVLTQEHGIDNWVRSVSHCMSKNRLYVGMYCSNIIKVYQLA